MVQIDNVVQFRRPGPGEHPSSGTSGVTRGLTDVIATMGHLVRQIDKWPMHERAKEKMLISVKSLALQACALQLAAVDETLNREAYDAEIDRIMSNIRTEA